MKSWIYSILTTVCLITHGRLFAEGDEVAPPPPDQSFWQTLVMIAIALVFFYIILWRPEQKRRKALEEQRGALKKGDRVSAMGILGTVDKITDQTVVLKMIDGARIEFVKGAISDVIPQTDEVAKKGS